MLDQAQQDLSTEDPLAVVDQYLTLQEAITWWQQDHGFLPAVGNAVNATEALQHLRQVRIPEAAKQPKDVPVQLRRRLLVDELWLTNSVHWQLRRQFHKALGRKLLNPTFTRVRLVQDPIYWYVFSGRRRENDFQTQVERLLGRYSLRGHVLLLDLAISEKHDVGQERLIQTLISWIHGGVVAGVLLAPPCETWSESRFIEPRLPSDPRPLRSHQDPFGIPGCTVKEIIQTTVANLLLCVAIRLLYHAVFQGIPAILEHPKEPRKGERAAIWRLPWIVQLKEAHLLSQRLIWQASYGSPSLKPTHIGLAHLPNAAAILAKHASPVNWQELITLGGRDLDGSWRTSRAKEYPPALNLTFADLLVSAYKDRQCSDPARSEMPDHLWQQFQDLYRGDVDIEMQTMQPDFHPRSDLFQDLD